jgi:hypothetical protein
MPLHLLLRFDSAAGLSWGLVFLLLPGPVGAWTGFAPEVVLGIAGANLLYGVCAAGVALTFAGRPGRVRGLGAANLGWGLLCLGASALSWPPATGLGRALLVGEGLAVGLLGLVELRRAHEAAGSGGG